MHPKTVTATLVNTYDARRRLVKDVGSDGPGREATTTYTAWDAAGRPTAGATVSKGSRGTLAIAYDNAARTMTTTISGGGGRVTCTMTFDANGNQTANVHRARRHHVGIDDEDHGHGTRMPLTGRPPAPPEL
jgi:hypothetical protein